MEEDDEINKIIGYESPNPEMRILNKKDAYLEKDMLSIACRVFNTESAIKKGKKVEKLTIPISSRTDTSRDIEKIAQLIHDLFLYVLIEDIDIEFDIQNLQRFKRGRLPQMSTCNTICLFSGGVDSLSALLTTKKRFEDVHAVSVLHGDQGRLSNIVDSLINDISKVEDIRFHKLYAPPMGSTGYSQLRGLLYALFGAIYVSFLNAENLVIGECGPTMYQPRFSPYDTVTMTTHPYVMETAKNIIEILLKRDINVITPYENMTKAEVIHASPYKEFYPKSHSCITSRFGNNEGTCYGCIVRRLGFLVAGIEDCKYTRDPIGNANHNADNLASLLRFNYDILFDRTNMPFYSIQTIESFKKQDLFYRFSLDNFAAIHIYKKQVGRLNPYIETLYNETFERIGEEKLMKRVEKVKRGTFKPNFRKLVGKQYFRTYK